jgi:hypothetical protein
MASGERAHHRQRHCVARRDGRPRPARRIENGSDVDDVIALDVHATGSRHHGIGHELIGRIAAIGLPTFCQFAAPFLPPVFERLTGEDSDEQWERTIQTPGGALATGSDP